MLEAVIRVALCESSEGRMDVDGSGCVYCMCFMYHEAEARTTDWVYVRRVLFDSQYANSMRETAFSFFDSD